MEYIVPMIFGKLGSWVERGLTSGGSLTAGSLIQSPQAMLYELQKSPVTAVLPLLGGWAAVTYLATEPGMSDVMKYAYAMGGGAGASFAGRMVGY